MFKLTDLRLTESDRADAVSVYQALDELIYDAHHASWTDGYEQLFESEGTIELFAELYVSAGRIWQGLNADMTREEAIVEAEDCFSRIYDFYKGRKIYFPAQFS